MKGKNRFLYLIIALYILPVVVLSLYASLIFTPSHSFGILSTGVLLTVAGSIVIFLFDDRQTPLPVPFVAQPVREAVESNECGAINEYLFQIEEQKNVIHECESQIVAFEKQLNVQTQTIAELNRLKESVEKKWQAAHADFSQQQKQFQSTQEETKLLLHEHQNTINEQRQTIEKKQQQIALLESQIRDLNYEIKTLMDVEERQSVIRFPIERNRYKEFEYTPTSSEEEDIPAPLPHVHSTEDASQQLKRCLDIAQKITGGQYTQGRSSRLRDLPVENTALEMRRLFDNLRSENQATILLYSPKENKLLFVNNPIKNLLGWTPDKFVFQFQELQTDGGDAWRNSLNQLSFKNESQASMLLMSKAGHPIALNCLLGLIPTGSFRHYVLGVLYPAK